jgi:hypothetical protein
VNVHNHFVGRGLAGRSKRFREFCSQLGFVGEGFATLVKAGNLDVAVD